jgi:hypothetical protein
MKESGKPSPEPITPEILFSFTAKIVAKHDPSKKSAVYLSKDAFRFWDLFRQVLKMAVK